MSASTSVGSSGTKSVPATVVDFAALAVPTAHSQKTPTQLPAEHHATVRALLVEIHELQLERVAAQAVHTSNAAQIAALTANLHDALAMHQQAQTKNQVLEFGIKLERQKNASLKSANGPNANGTDSASNHAVPSSDPSSQAPIDPTLYASYMAAMGAASSSSSSNSGFEVKYAAHSQPAVLTNKTPATANAQHTSFGPTTTTSLSHATTALPGTAIKVPRTKATAAGHHSSTDDSSSGDALNFSYEKSPSKPIASSAASSTSSNSSPPQFKPPTLNANMFMPPSADEIAAEIALAKSPPVVHHGVFTKDGRARSDHAASSLSGDDDGGGLDRKSTVYNYSSGSPEALPPAALPIVPGSVIQTGNGATYTYGGEDEENGGGHNLGATAIDLSSLAAQSSKANGSTQPASAAGHTRIASASSAFTPLGGGAGAGAGGKKEWKPRLFLRAHLDSVRCVRWDQQEDQTASTTWLLSGSEDGTALIWNLTTPLLAAANAKAVKNAPQAMPTHAYRGHLGAVTAVALSSATKSAFTGGIDGNLCSWILPTEGEHDMYSSHGASAALRRAVMKFSQPVWSIDVHERTLLVGVADGTVAIVEAGENSLTLLRSVRRAGSDAKPVSVTFLPQSKGGEGAVAYTDGVVCIFSVSSGSITRTLNEPSDGTDPSRITQLIAHPTNDTLISSHADASIRYWDLKSGERCGVIQAHRASVSCIGLDGDGTTLVSGSHDESIRIWSAQERKIRQVLDTHQTHRLKYDEAIHSVSFHPLLPYLVSAGGDGIVKVYV